MENNPLYQALSDTPKEINMFPEEEENDNLEYTIDIFPLIDDEGYSDTLPIPHISRPKPERRSRNLERMRAHQKKIASK